MPASPLPSLGDRIRAERTRQGVSLRALARTVGVSASMISQIETGKAQPSVGTLYAITSVLGMSMHDIFNVSDVDRDGVADASMDGLADARRRPATVLEALGSQLGGRLGPLVRPAQRQVLRFDSGVIWERLGHVPPARTHFLRVSYAPDGSSAQRDALVRHPGWEYGFLFRGELTLTLGSEEVLMRPGDAVSFDSRTPHRYHNDGTEDAVGVWFVVEDPTDDTTDELATEGGAEG